MVLGFDLDAVATEEVECVLGEGTVEHWQDLGSDIKYCDLYVGNKGWVELFEILVAEVE